MSLRSFLILVAVVLALTCATPLLAAPLAQADVEIDEVVVTSTSAFTLTVRIDEVTTVAIPLQVDWRAQGPTVGAADEVSVVISPTVLRTGFFSVTVGEVEAGSGTLAITLAEPEDEIVPITRTATTTATLPTTTTVTPTVTTPITVPTANAISNLRAGPSTEYAIVGSASAGDALEVVGRNADGTWFVLANGTWIAAFLVDNPPVDLPVVEAPPLPAPSPGTTGVVTPTIIPTVTPTP
jgi:hypothetical protein